MPQHGPNNHPAADAVPVLSQNNKTFETDRKFSVNCEKQSFVNYLFVRLVAKDKTFSQVDFRYAFFNDCYLRDCRFDSCDFTGCRFIGTNFHGSRFSGCKFDYAIFEKTFIDADILDTECPGAENVRQRFARSLRMNYQQLGDAKAANKAIRVELKATEDHLFKAWRSNERYYRHKYKGWGRLKSLAEWLGFKTLDSIWGNGESALKLVRACVIFLVVVTLIDAIGFGDPTKVATYYHALLRSPEIFLGTVSPTTFPSGLITSIVLVRLIAFGLFMSIIIKRLGRR